MARKSTTDAAGVTTYTDTQDPQQEPLTGEVADKWYVVLHNCVGRWWQGQTISADHLQGHDIDRLLSLGAIGEVGSDAHVMASRDGLATFTPDNVPTSDPVPLPPVPAPVADETHTTDPALTTGG